GGFGGQFGLQGGMNPMNPFVNRYQLQFMNGNFGNGAQFGNLGAQFGQQGGQGQAQVDNNLGNNSLNARLNYDQLQQRRREQQVARANARRIGSSVAGLDPGAGVSSIASADEIGDYFQYTIDDKVTLPRQKSAMLPVVNKDVEATRVSIYNEGVQAKFPLLGLRFKNTSDQ